MANYKPLKVIFDLDDPYQLSLYKYIKDKSNASAFIRTLIHLDMASRSNTNIDVIPEQTNTRNKTESRSIDTQRLTYQQIDEDDEFILDGLY